MGTTEQPATDNLRHWTTLYKTDPAHTKQFTSGGGFRGTAIKPIYATQKMTEHFGPCGIGWGMAKPEFQLVNGDNRELLVYCTVCLWYMDSDTRAEVYGVGGDKVIGYVKASQNRPERWENDDEAFKKAYTDALGNAMKQIGVGGDVHMGQFDDLKYRQEVEREFAEERLQAKAPDVSKSIADLETELRDKLPVCTNLEALEQLWKLGEFGTRLRDIGRVNKAEQDRLTAMFSTRKAEILRSGQSEPHTVLGAGD